MRPAVSSGGCLGAGRVNGGDERGWVGLARRSSGDEWNIWGPIDPQTFHSLADAPPRTSPPSSPPLAHTQTRATETALRHLELRIVLGRVHPQRRQHELALGLGRRAVALDKVRPPPHRRAAQLPANGQAAEEELGPAVGELAVGRCVAYPLIELAAARWQRPAQRQHAA